MQGRKGLLAEISYLVAFLAKLIHFFSVTVIMKLMNRGEETRQKFQRGYRANRKALRKLRSTAHMSTKKLGQASGVNYTTINRIENGHNRSPQWPTLEQLADALGVEVDELVIYDDFDGVDGGANPQEREWQLDSP